MYNPPSTVRGAKKAISARLKQLPLAKSEAQRIELSEEIAQYAEYLYPFAKAGEAASAALTEEPDEE